jgi:hypothetical protein
MAKEKKNLILVSWLRMGSDAACMSAALAAPTPCFSPGLLDALATALLRLRPRNDTELWNPESPFPPLQLLFASNPTAWLRTPPIRNVDAMSSPEPQPSTHPSSPLPSHRLHPAPQITLSCPNGLQSGFREDQSSHEFLRQVRWRWGGESSESPALPAPKP